MNPDASAAGSSTSHGRPDLAEWSDGRRRTRRTRPAARHSIPELDPPVPRSIRTTSPLIGSEHRYVRHESEAHRLDRNYTELLQELRVAQAGVQILFAFLLTIAFQQRFARVELLPGGSSISSP